MSEDVSNIIIGQAVKGATSQIVKEYISTIVTPFTNLISNQKSQVKIRSNLNKYIKFLEFRTRTIPSIAMPSGVFPLDEVFEPPTLRSEMIEMEIKIDSYPSTLFSCSRCCAITDDAGMGKSTLAKYIARKAVQEKRSIPLFIELRKIGGDTSIIDSLCRELAGSPTDNAELIELIKGGNFTFILDGYDEVDDESRPKITEEINRITSDYQFCNFILTSRKEYGSSLFPEYMYFEINELNIEQAYSIIKKYDQKRGRDKLLIAKIEEAEIDEFLTNPLLVTLLYKSFDYRQSIPPRKALFYRQVYDALFMDHDLSKGDAFERKKSSNLDIEEFHKLLRCIGIVTLKTGKISYSQEEFHGHLVDAISRLGKQADPQKIKSDLIKSVPLFAKDGGDIKWAHKSFQEYFASQYIFLDSGESRLDVLKAMYDESNIDRFINILSLYSESDPLTIRDHLIEPFLSRINKAESEMEFKIRLIEENYHLFVICGIPERSEIKGKSTFVDVIRKTCGIDLSQKVTRIHINHARKFAIVAAMKSSGFKLATLSILDKQIFPAIRRLFTLQIYGTLYAAYKNQAVFDILSSRGEILKALHTESEINELAIHVGMPPITKDICKLVQQDKEQRNKVAKISELLDL